MKIIIFSVRFGSRTGEQRKNAWRRMQVGIAGLSFIKVSNAAEEELKWRRKAQLMTRDSVTVNWASEVLIVWTYSTNIYYYLKERFLKGICQSCCRTNIIMGAYKLLSDTSAAALECVFVAIHMLPCIVQSTVSFLGKFNMAISFYILVTPLRGHWRILLPLFVAMMELIGKERQF